uniref:Uncharacterized protein n=1 Tax=Ixodes ricinus TaxID=34613 RepID=A0A6B0V4U5_IXORI
MASLLPAWLPPLITLNAGTGRITFELPARSAMCRYTGTPFWAAPARHTARDTPRMALAPRLPLFSVPSSSIMNSSIWNCSRTSKFLAMSCGAITLFTLSTALKTLLPWYMDLSPSLSSRASWIPVEAPDGTAARNNPFSVVKSTSTVGLPLLSKIWRANILVIGILASVLLRRRLQRKIITKELPGSSEGAKRRSQRRMQPRERKGNSGESQNFHQGKCHAYFYDK